MNEIKLLKCPFCGGEAKIDKTITNTVSVECTVCHASSRMILCTEGDIEQKAIEAWNTRKPLERIVERLEILYDEAQDKLSDNFIYYDGRGDGVDMAMRVVKEEGGMNEIM